MNYQGVTPRQNIFVTIRRDHGVGLANFFSSLKYLGPLVLQGRRVAGARVADLDPGIVSR